MPEAFEPFPEVMALGQHRLQQLCDEWCLGPVAKEFGVVQVNIPPDCRSFDPMIGLFASNYDQGDEVPFPFDRMMTFIIDNGCPEPDKERLKLRLVALRQKVGERLFQRYSVNVPAFSMAFRCRACSQLMISEHRIFKGQEFKGQNFDAVTCQRCGFRFAPRNVEFFPVIDRLPPSDF